MLTGNKIASSTATWRAMAVAVDNSMLAAVAWDKRIEKRVDTAFLKKLSK